MKVTNRDCRRSLFCEFVSECAPWLRELCVSHAERLIHISPEDARRTKLPHIFLCWPRQKRNSVHNGGLVIFGCCCVCCAEGIFIFASLRTLAHTGRPFITRPKHTTFDLQIAYIFEYIYGTIYTLSRARVMPSHRLGQSRIARWSLRQPTPTHRSDNDDGDDGDRADDDDTQCRLSLTNAGYGVHRRHRPTEPS